MIRSWLQITNLHQTVNLHRILNLHRIVSLILTAPVC